MSVEMTLSSTKTPPKRISSEDFPCLALAVEDCKAHDAGTLLWAFKVGHGEAMYYTYLTGPKKGQTFSDAYMTLLGTCAKAERGTTLTITQE